MAAGEIDVLQEPRKAQPGKIDQLDVIRRRVSGTLLLP